MSIRQDPDKEVSTVFDLECIRTRRTDLIVDPPCPNGLTDPRYAGVIPVVKI